MTDEEAVTTAISEIEALRKQVAELTSDENSKSYFAKYLVEKNKRQRLDEQVAELTKNWTTVENENGVIYAKLAAMTKERDESVQAEMENHERIALLREALSEASNEISDWGQYASEYFQDKYKLTEVVERFAKIAAGE